jgi:WD40 repeat protein
MVWHKFGTVIYFYFAAIGWSPHHHGILASGGGTFDHCIRFWNTLTGYQVKCVDTGYHVSNLAWSTDSSELVSFMHIKIVLNFVKELIPLCLEQGVKYLKVMTFVSLYRRLDEMFQS